MKTLNMILKLVTALAAVAGVVYIIATYGEQIVAWAKRTLACLPKCPDCQEAPVAEAVPVDEPAPAPVAPPAPAAPPAPEEVSAAEAPEEPAPAVVVAEHEPVAEETDFADAE